MEIIPATIKVVLPGTQISSSLESTPKLLKQSKLIKLFLTSFCCLHAKAASSDLREMLD